MAKQIIKHTKYKIGDIVFDTEFKNKVVLTERWDRPDRDQRVAWKSYVYDDPSKEYIVVDEHLTDIEK